MSTHKRTRSDSEDSMMSSRSSSLLKRIKLDEHHNSSLRIHPSESSPIPQERPAPTTASTTFSPCKSGALERLDSMSTNLVLDAYDRATSNPIILHAVTPYFQGGRGLIITRPGVFANTPIHQEMRKAVEADQYKFVISFSKATQEPSHPSFNTSATNCPTFPLSPYGSGALQHHILNFCDTLAATQDATPSFLHRLVSSSFAQSSVSDGFKDMFPIMIYRDHHTGTVVSRFFTFSATDNSITGTDNSAPIQDGPTERIFSESGTGALTVDGEDLQTASDSGSDMDLGSDADMDSRKVGLKAEGPLLAGALAAPLVPLYESESSGSEGSVVAVGIMEILRQIRHKH